MTSIVKDECWNNSNAFLKASLSVASLLGGVFGNRKQNAQYMIDIPPENFNASTNLEVTLGTSAPAINGGIA